MVRLHSCTSTHTGASRITDLAAAFAANFRAPLAGVMPTGPALGSATFTENAPPATGIAAGVSRCRAPPNSGPAQVDNYAR